MEYEKEKRMHSNIIPLFFCKQPNIRRDIAIKGENSNQIVQFTMKEKFFLRKIIQRADRNNSLFLIHARPNINDNQNIPNYDSL